jgi:hypothetical protein
MGFAQRSVIQWFLKMRLDKPHRHVLRKITTLLNFLKLKKISNLLLISDTYYYHDYFPVGNDSEKWLEDQSGALAAAGILCPTLNPIRD